MRSNAVGPRLLRRDCRSARAGIRDLGKWGARTSTPSKILCCRPALPYGRASVSRAHVDERICPTQRRDRKGALVGCLSRPLFSLLSMRTRRSATRMSMRHAGSAAGSVRYLCCDCGGGLSGIALGGRATTPFTASDIEMLLLYKIWPVDRSSSTRAFA